MPELDFTIKTTAELDGAQATATSLERSIGAAKAAGKDFSELQRQLNKVNESLKDVSPELKKLGENEDEAGRLTEFLHHNHRQLHELLRMTPGVAGEAGESLLAMAHGPVGPLLALAGALRMVFSILDEVESQRLPDLSSGIDQANNYATAWNGIATAIDSVTQAYNSSEDVHARSLKAIGSELKAQKDYIQAVKDRAMAELNVQRAAGMDQGEYDRKKDIIENGASDQEAQAEIAARNAQLAADKKEADQAAAEAAAAAAKAQNFKGPQTKEQAEAEAAAQKIVVDAERKKQEEAEARVNQIQDVQTDVASMKSYGQAIMVGLEGIREAYRSASSDNSKLSLTDAGNAANLTTEQKAAADAKARADAAEAEAERIKKAGEERERLQKDAEEKAKKAAELQAKIAPEFAPDAATKPGTVAYENAQAAARQRDRDNAARINSDVTAFSADKKTVEADSRWLNSNAPTAQNIGEYRAKIAEMSNAVADMVAIMNELSSLGADTKKLAISLTALQKDAAETKNIANQALSNSQLL